MGKTALESKAKGRLWIASIAPVWFREGFWIGLSVLTSPALQSFVALSAWGLDTIRGCQNLKGRILTCPKQVLDLIRPFGFPWQVVG